MEIRYSGKLHKDERVSLLSDRSIFVGFEGGTLDMDQHVVIADSGQ
jgi:hypothetical protein